MAAVPIEIRGTLYDLATKSARQVYLVGEAARSDVGVGGGPMPPGEGGGSPPGFWGGGNVPMPSPPISNVPGAPGYRPPGIWGGPIDPYPGHPLPEPPGKPTEPPEPPTADKPPPASGGWGWMASASAWGYFPAPTEPGPKQ